MPTEMSESVRNRPGKLTAQPSETVRMGLQNPSDSDASNSVGKFGRRLSEDAHQILVMTWARKMAIAGRSELDLLFHVPNGGGRSKGEGAKLKSMGVKAGVSDLFLPVMVLGCGGLWIEMKTDGGVVSEAQDEWIGAMSVGGYKAVVCYGWEEAVEAIKSYLGGKWPEVDMGGCLLRVRGGV